MPVLKDAKYQYDQSVKRWKTCIYCPVCLIAGVQDEALGLSESIP